MEKSCEGTRGGGGGNSSASRSSSSGFTSNTTRRPYNMLSSIINLSSSTTTAASNTSSSVAGTAVLKTARESVPCSSPSKTPNKSYAGGNHHHQHQKISPDEPKKVLHPDTFHQLLLQPINPHDASDRQSVSQPASRSLTWENR